MSSVQDFPSTLTRRRVGVGSVASPTHATSAPGQRIGILPSSRGFVAMLTAYRPTGGTARSDDLGRLLEDRPYGDSMSLARLVNADEVFRFEWRNTFWIPMFQFDLHDLSVKPGPRKVLAEFAGVLDGWALASWFAESNTWLNGARPVDKVDADLTALLDAARTDRFIAAG